MRLILSGLVIVAALVHLGLYTAQESRLETAPRRGWITDDGVEVWEEPERRYSLKGWPGWYILALVLVQFIPD